MKDYKKLGLKIGIEIHQRLNTKKLFCNCDSILREDNPHITIRRKLRAVAGESGIVDNAARHEMAKDLIFEYEGYNDTTCLVEFDEEPPHNMNDDALNIVLQVTKMLNAKPVDLVQVMRKTVVNGSNTSGFQRTSLIALNGNLNTSKGNVKIDTICIEEESAKDIKQEGNVRTFRLDRLGIPLIEIATAPDIIDPEHCKETAEKIGLILRSTGKVARGLGTIRQDLNVSIEGGNRIEIKGAQDLDMIPTLIENEINRQIGLLEIKEKLPDEISINNEFLDLSPILKNCESKIIQSTLKNNGIILGVKLPHFAGLIGKELQPNKRLGTEFSDYAKQKVAIGGIFHSDELPKYGILQEDVDKIRETLKCVSNDGFVIVAEKPRIAELALEGVITRAKMCKLGVPKEVRKANPDGTTSFMRPMPGAARMYPETDVEEIILPSLEKIELPELIEDKIKRYNKEYQMAPDLCELAAKSEKNYLFEKVIKTSSLKPAFIAETIFSKPREIKRKYNVDQILFSDAVFEKLFVAYEEKIISKDAILEILSKLGTKDFNKLIEDYKLISDEEINTILKEIINDHDKKEKNEIMSKAMGKLKGKADGKKIIDMINELIK